MFDLKIIEKVQAKFQWKNNRKTILKAKEDAQLAQSETGTILQLQITNHFNINDVKQIALDSNGQVPELIKNATGRMAIEQAIMQENLEKTVKLAKLENIDDPKPFEKDWFMEWMSVAQKISKEEIRAILVKILRKEASDGHSTSLKTLEVLKTLEKDELELFSHFCNISFSLPIENVPDSILVVAEPYEGSPSSNSLKSIGLSYANLTKLQDLGLIKSDLTSNHPLVGVAISQSWPYYIGSNLYVPTEKYKFVKDYQVKVILFTKVGLQLRECLELESNEDYENKFKEWVDTKFTKMPKPTGDIESE
jgi:Protein of unknown function (DUF2806)